MRSRGTITKKKDLQAVHVARIRMKERGGELHFNFEHKYCTSISKASVFEMSSP